MHKLIAVTLLIALLALAGCKAAATNDAGTTSTDAGSTPSAIVGAPRGNDVMSLALGTLALDGTSDAVDAAQAPQLLPLWKAYRALLASDATAPAELTALVTQIRGTMTAEQTTALDTQIDPEAQSALMARFGLEMPALGGTARTLPEGMTEEEFQTQMAERQAARAASGEEGPSFRVEGGPGAGGFPGGGAGPMGGAGGVIIGGGEGFVEPGVQAAAGGGAGVQAGVNTWVTSLVDAVITYLEGIQ